MREGAEIAPFFYAKNNPSVSMTEEMLANVPHLYEQEDTNFADKTVHAAYFIPFRSNWTWYMTEYDRESEMPSVWLWVMKPNGDTSI